MDSKKIEAAKHLLVMLRSPLFMLNRPERERIILLVTESGLNVEELISVALESARNT